MKRIKVLLIGFCLLFTLTILSACYDDDNDSELSIVCTIFPEYDWVKTIINNTDTDINVKLLLDNGVDLHSFEPTINDIMAISKCDLFIYVGGESDGWVKDALAEAVNKDMVVISLLDVLGELAIEEEDENAYDEHVWLSIKNAKIFTEEIYKAICKIDEGNSALYKTNKDKYLNELNNLDTKYHVMVDEATHNIVVFGDRFPFIYLINDYNLKYFAAFEGCSAETEASTDTIIFLAKKINENGIKVILIIENSSDKIAKTIKENTISKNQTILVIDSLQSVTTKDIENGTTYLSIMESNFEVLKQALN